MSDEEYDDELPPISVNSSGRDSQRSLLMPSAEELASQRAREAECERELQLLRTADNEPILATTDSSGSEGEAALAAAVTALRVGPPLRAAPAPLDALLPALLARVPGGAALLDRAPRATHQALVEHMCAIALLDDLPSGDQVLVGVVLCAGALGSGTRGARRDARRALHVLLERAPIADADSEVSVAFSSAVLEGILPSQRLALADALTAVLPASAAAARLQRRLLVATLAELLKVEVPVSELECSCEWSARVVCAAWARLEACAAGACVRACGRLLRACPAPALCASVRARLLQALVSGRPRARAGPDLQQALVGASKLQLLFRE